MISVDRLVAAQRERADAGAAVALMRLTIESLPIAAGDRSTAWTGLRQALTRCTEWTAGELGTARRLLSEIGVEPDEDSLDARSRVEEHLAGITPEPSSPVPGVANVLLASDDGPDPFGTVRALSVTTTRWGGSVELRPDAAQCFYGAFRGGCLAAFHHLSERELKTLSGAILLDNRRVLGEIRGVRAQIRGESVGLAAAIGAWSSLLGLPVPREIGFTGRVRANGSIGSVRGVSAKLQACVDSGLRKVLIPHEQQAEGRAFPALKMQPVNTLSDVIPAVFDGLAWRDAVDQLRAEPVPLKQQQRHWRQTSDAHIPERRVLLSAVARADPLGTVRDREGAAVGREDGPILTVCREVRPSTLYLLYTTSGPNNDFSASARAVEAGIREQNPDCKVHHVPLADLTDPTDIEEIVPRFTAAVREIETNEDEADTRFFVNLASGTPQMAIAWHLLAERHVLPPATLMHVRESRFVPPGESRVRTVILPGV